HWMSLSGRAESCCAIESPVRDCRSTDRSVEVTRRCADRLAWWRSPPDRGQVDALNEGFRRARGEILGWLCSDDTLLSGAVSCLVSELESHPEALIAYGHALWTDERSELIGTPKSRPWDLRTMARGGGQHVAQPASLWRRPACGRGGPAMAYPRPAWPAYHAGDRRRARRLALHSLVVSPWMSRRTAAFVARALVRRA